MTRNFYKIYITLILTSILLLSQSCDDSITDSDINSIVFPDSNVSYAQYVAPVFEVRCVPCHNDQRSDGGVNLSSWSQVVSDPRIVFPGSDSTSVLVWTIEGLQNTAPMPPSGRMKENHIQGIRTWIREGALYN